MLFCKTSDSRRTGIMGFKYGVADSLGNITQVINSATGQTEQMRAAVYLKTPELPTDPGLVDQWYLSETNILPVWQDYTGAGITIGQFEPSGPYAVSNEVYDYRHPDLQANVDPNWLASGTASTDFSNHATLVAGVMVAANNEGWRMAA